MLEKMSDFFEKRLDEYDKHMLKNIESADEFYPFTAKCLPTEKNCHILDLGCGTGLELEEYFSFNPSVRVTGIDLSQGMLSALKKKFADKNITLVLGSYFDVPFGESVFDTAVSVESLHHFTKEEKIPLYVKLHEALKDDGYFILTDYFSLSEEEELMHRQNLIAIKAEQGITDDGFYHYDTPLTVEHETEALLEAGFSFVEVMNNWGATYTLKAIKQISVYPKSENSYTTEICGRMQHDEPYINLANINERCKIMLEYKIEGGNLPVVICSPEAGQTLCTEKGSMSWMSPNMKMETNAGGIKKAIGRIFSGESIFLNEYTAVGSRGMIAFASSFPGTIIPYEVSANNGIIVQKKGFLAMEKGLELSVYFQKKLGKGLFGGEGFIMQKITGNGIVFLEIDGYCKEYDLASGESIIVDTGHLAAMAETCTMDIETVKGVKNIFFGGEGVFLTKVTGPGKVYLQSMPIVNVAGAIRPYITPPSSDSGIKISLGEN